MRSLQRKEFVDQGSADFAEFYERSRDGCFRAVHATVGDGHQAEELVSEAFARAWASWQKVRQHPAPQAWVVRTALNTHISWWRRRRREIALEKQDLDEPADGDTVSAIDRHVMAALQALPSRQREVIAMRVFLDLDTQATAEALGIAPGTVKSHLHRACAALRDQLGSDTYQEPSR